MFLLQKFNPYSSAFLMMRFYNTFY